MTRTAQLSSLFDLKPTHNAHRWHVKVTPKMTVGPDDRRFLFGGMGLACAIEALEQTTGRPTIWATAQYLSFAGLHDIVDIDVIIPKAGNSVTQARVLGHVQDREIFTVNAAVGERDSDISEQWPAMPGVPDPADCPPMQRYQMKTESLHDQFEMRVCEGLFGSERKGKQRSETGRSAFWARPKQQVPYTPSVIAIIADFVPSGAGSSLGRDAGANSLDNTLRIHRTTETDWLYCEIQTESIHNGFVHGRMMIFTKQGELVASASQSGILRVRD